MSENPPHARFSMSLLHQYTQENSISELLVIHSLHTKKLAPHWNEFLLFHDRVVNPMASPVHEFDLKVQRPQDDGRD